MEVVEVNRRQVGTREQFHYAKTIARLRKRHNPDDTELGSTSFVELSICRNVANAGPRQVASLLPYVSGTDGKILCIISVAYANANITAFIVTPFIRVANTILKETLLKDLDDPSSLDAAEFDATKINAFDFEAFEADVDSAYAQYLARAGSRPA